MTHDPVAWLAAEQPAIAAPDAAATARARRALLVHAGPAPAATRPAAALRLRADRRWLRPSRVLALAAVAGVATAAAVGIPALTGGDGPLAVPEASAAPLVRLSQRVLAEPAPAGDATLVRRTHHFADGGTMTGADLYLDDGRYFYGATVAELRATVRHGDDIGPDIAREVAAVAAASDSGVPVQTALERAAASTLAPGVPQAPPAAQAAERAAILKAKGVTDPSPPASAQEIADNRVWIACIDALQAAAGRTDVRAGALRLLAAVTSVTVETTTVAGRPALVVSSTGFPDGYREQLAMDPDTGIPFRFEGGTPGEEPSVVVDYAISRVTASGV